MTKIAFLSIVLIVMMLWAMRAQAQTPPYAWGINMQQIDEFGTGFINRSRMLPSGNRSAIMMYDNTTNEPELGVLDSTLQWSSGPALGLSASKNAEIAGKLNQPSGSALQYIRGDGSLGTFPTNLSTFSNDTGYITTSALSGYLLASTAASTYATQSALTSGLAGKFNNPSGTIAQYIDGTGALRTFPSISSGTVTSVGITSSNLSVSGSPVTTSGNISVSLPNLGTPSTYSAVTTDSQGRVVSGTIMSINDSPARTLVTTTTSTGYQVSASRNSRVCYEGVFNTTSTIGGPASATVFLETADTNSTTASDWTVRARQTYTNNITLAVVLNQAQANNWSFCRDIPAGKFVRIRSGSISGTASVTLNPEQQETLH